MIGIQNGHQNPRWLPFFWGGGGITPPNFFLWNQYWKCWCFIKQNGPHNSFARLGHTGITFQVTRKGAEGNAGVSIDIPGVRASRQRPKWDGDSEISSTSGVGSRRTDENWTRSHGDTDSNSHRTPQSQSHQEPHRSRRTHSRQSP